MDWEDERAALLARGLTASDRERLDLLRKRVEKGQPPPEVTAGRWLNVRPDPIDFRDRFFEPGLRPLRAMLEPDLGVSRRHPGTCPRSVQSLHRHGARRGRRSSPLAALA